MSQDFADTAMSLSALEIKEKSIKWEVEQKELRKRIVTENCEAWQNLKLSASESETDDPRAIRYVGGMDISYLKSDDNVAFAAIVVCELPSLKVVRKHCELVELKEPYVAGFLSYREAQPLIQIYQKFMSSSTECLPQAILIDGNGMLHAREFGLACHVGVELDICTIGVAKNLFHVDEIAKDDKHMEQIQSLVNKGDTFPLIGTFGCTLGLALKTAQNAKKPVYVSVGHKISLESAVWLVKQCSLYRVPEPVRQADMISRTCIREM